MVFMGRHFFWGVFCLLVSLESLSAQGISRSDQLLKQWQDIDASQGWQSLTEILLQNRLSLAESQEFMRSLKKLLPAERSSDFLSNMMNTYAQRTFDRLEAPTAGMWFWRKSSEDLARGLKIYWRKNFLKAPEPVFFAVMHFSKNDFDDPEDVLDFYLKDSLSFLSANLGDEKRDFKNLVVIHLGDQLARWNQWLHRNKEMSIESWSQLIMILDVPRLLLGHFKTKDHLALQFAWPEGSYLFYRSKFLAHYERALKHLFAFAPNSPMLVLAANGLSPASLDMEQHYHKLLIDGAEKLARYALSFREFGLYIENALPQDERLRRKIEDMSQLIHQRNLSLLASVELFLKEIKNLPSRDRENLKVIEQIGHEIIHHDFCRKMLSSLSTYGI